MSYSGIYLNPFVVLENGINESGCTRVNPRRNFRICRFFFFKLREFAIFYPEKRLCKNLSSFFLSHTCEKL